MFKIKYIFREVSSESSFEERLKNFTLRRRLVNYVPRAKFDLLLVFIKLFETRQTMLLYSEVDLSRYDRDHMA